MDNLTLPRLLNKLRRTDSGFPVLRTTSAAIVAVGTHHLKIAKSPEA